MQPLCALCTTLIVCVEPQCLTLLVHAKISLYYREIFVWDSVDLFLSLF